MDWFFKLLRVYKLQLFTKEKNNVIETRWERTQPEKSYCTVQYTLLWPGIYNLVSKTFEKMAITCCH